MRALHIITRAFLVVACVFWVLILLELTPVLALSGMDGTREAAAHLEHGQI